MEDWYNISSLDIAEYGGKGLLNLYKGSLLLVLENFFPEMNWKPWKFEEFSKESWHDLKIQRKFFDELSTKLHINTMEDWYSIKEKQVIDLGGKDLLDIYHGSLYESLVAVYPGSCPHMST